MTADQVALPCAQEMRRARLRKPPDPTTTTVIVTGWRAQQAKRCETEKKYRAHRNPVWMKSPLNTADGPGQPVLHQLQLESPPANFFQSSRINKGLCELNCATW
ncbi:hypothetical protein GE21DRAFT_1197750 [Neurospora crassa]|nr:hypothetical protein B24P7.90 [imported] - Neurospora crassa [Neurospora crassa]KHE89228.1 hypothetical protein GE21DRAFT_1197750 [Neurospora crassa]